MLLSTLCSEIENYIQKIFVVWEMNKSWFCQLFQNSWHLLSSIWMCFTLWLFIFHSWMLILRPSWLCYIYFLATCSNTSWLKWTIINQWRGILVEKLNRWDWTGCWVEWQDSIAVSVFVLFWLSLTNTESETNPKAIRWWDKQACLLAGPKHLQVVFHRGQKLIRQF